MELKQQLVIPRAVEAVWQALNDPKMLQQCLPGCQHFEQTDANAYDMTVSAKIGPVKATFKGAIALQNLNPPFSYEIAGEGKGGVAGFAKGGAQVWLDAVTDSGLPATRLSYSVSAAVGGKIAQLGGRLIQGAARKMAQDFFTQFVRRLCDDEDLDLTIETIETN
ncbi:MAG: carbon monoxide dehydrogenase subunit G [Pseudomonadales bacterium]|jgi:carbon monoxide dehydrogenase subunit G|tara:strand:- start:3742 stop:4236 length:495 start_codon:yes stop_codon:yes gene_type:complete